MKLATIPNGTADGRLVVVSPSLDRGLPAAGIAATMQEAIERWSEVEGPLRTLWARAEAGEGEPFDPSAALAPLPRAWQWLDGSAFSTHAKLMQVAFALAPIETDRPLMYQGLSDRFYAPSEEVPFRSTGDWIDFEGEFGVIVDAVPMGTSADEAMSHIKLVVQINDWSLRAIAPIEMKTGFGWVQAKPACSMAPIAVTPDALGDAWRDGRVALDLVIDWNGERFGAANGGAMDFGFHELVAHAARTRDLVPGTIIGSGTIANADYAEVGSSCISERRAIEMIANGAATTRFMDFGDTVRMEARAADGSPVFGAIDQRVVRRSA